MVKTLVVIVLLVVTYNTFACTVPGGGDEYNALIKIEYLDNGKIKVTAPQKANDLNYGATFTLRYYEKEKYSRFRSSEHIKTLRVKEKGEYFESIFEIEHITGFTPFVMVFWEAEVCCLCGAFGYSADLLQN